MNFNNLINDCLNYLFVIGNMSICKLIIKFVVFLTSLIKIKSAQPLNICNFIKILGLLSSEMGLFPQLFLGGGGLRPRPWVGLGKRKRKVVRGKMISSLLEIIQLTFGTFSSKYFLLFSAEISNMFQIIVIQEVVEVDTLFNRRHVGRDTVMASSEISVTFQVRKKVMVHCYFLPKPEFHRSPNTSATVLKQIQILLL